jgi:hypothetical protein
MCRGDPSIDRRRFLSGLAAGSLAVSSPSCATWSSSPALDRSEIAREVDEFCSLFDRGLRRIERMSIVGHAIDAERPDVREYLARVEPIAKRGLGSMHVAGAFADLSEVARADDRVQARMAAFAPEMDRAVFESKRLLETLPEADRERLLSRRTRSAGMRLAEALDDEAREIGVSARTRTKLRVVARHVTSRLAQEPAAVLIDEYVFRVEAVTARSGGDVDAQTRATARAAEEIFWSAQRSTEPPAYHRWGPVPPPPPAPEGTPGSAVAITGGWMIGVGATIFGLSAVLVASADILGLFGLTVGAVGVVAGLIVLLIGGIIMASS